MGDLKTFDFFVVCFVKLVLKNMITSGRGTNPFGDEDDDGAFVRNSYRTDTSGFNDFNDDEVLTPGQRREQLKQESIQRQMDSMNTALSSIHQSESMGIATAEELMQQGEQLDNIERKADYINAEMKNTQKSIDSIKSVWGSLGQWWSTKKKKPDASEPVKNDPPPVNNRSQKLQHALDNSRNSNPHPSMRVRSEDTQGFYDNTQSTEPFRSNNSNNTQRPASTKQKSLMEDYYEKSDANLDAMGDGLSRLKGLAAGLGSEINAQNEQLERLQPKIGQASDSIDNQ